MSFNSVSGATDFSSLELQIFLIIGFVTRCKHSSYSCSSHCSWVCLWLWSCPLWHWVLCMISPFLHMLTLPVCLRVCADSFSVPLTPPLTGRVSLTRGASLLIERLTLEDEGWFECRILLLESKTDDFRNGTWTFLSITGAAPQGFGDSRAAPFVAHHWHCPYLEQLQHGAWLGLWRPWQAE